MRTNAYDLSYAYDGAGNRTLETDNLLSGLTTHVYDAANKLLTSTASLGIPLLSNDY